MNQDVLDELAKKLSVKYKTVAEIIGYLNTLEKETSAIRQWEYVPLVETWAKFNKEAFINIIKDKNLLESVPVIFHLGIYRTASIDNKKYISDIAKEITGDLENLSREKIDILLDLISRHKVSVDEFMPWLIAIIKHADNFLKSHLLHRVYFLFNDREQEEKNRVSEILEESLNGIVDSYVLDMFDFLLDNALEWNIPEKDLERMRVILLEIIKDIEKIDHHTDKLIKFVVNDDLGKFIKLVEYRLNKYAKNINKKKGRRFDPVPFEGFQSLEGLVKNYDDFSRLMDRIYAWRKADLLYSFDVEGLLKTCKKSDDQLGDYLGYYIGEKIVQENLESTKIAIDALYGVHFGVDTADLFLDVLNKSEKFDLIEEAKSVFSHQVITGSYGGTLGEAPPALVAKKDALDGIHSKCPPGMIKNYIDSLRRSVADDIKRHVDEGQEMINPKH